ncbi:BQ2448_1917 [Microbotryum intermedium]|uniref:BQ2448_1917 protein n=1 Tax=Microbotryum intermedium TaxID=269621 RepID=A0A238FEV1_9BASI|nr:BQ2448_1917 [Microbotryum intermedium]
MERALYLCQLPCLFCLVCSERVLGRARAYKIVYKITRFGDPKAQQKSTHGNTLIFSQNTASFTDVLPISVEELADSVCALFCGDTANLADLGKCRRMVVRQSRMLRWSITESKNPAYCRVSFDGERRARLVQPGSDLNSFLSASTAVSTSSSKTHYTLDFVCSPSDPRA